VEGAKEPLAIDPRAIGVCAIDPRAIGGGVSIVTLFIGLLVSFTLRVPRMLGLVRFLGEIIALVEPDSLRSVPRTFEDISLWALVIPGVLPFYPPPPSIFDWRPA
jgi:hypothetical protein